MFSCLAGCMAGCLFSSVLHGQDKTRQDKTRHKKRTIGGTYQLILLFWVEFHDQSIMKHNDHDDMGFRSAEG